MKVPEHLIAKKEKAIQWFQTLHYQIAHFLENLEATFAQKKGGKAGKIGTKSWERPGGGGGTMALMEGQVFEKAGVNFSAVFGEFSEYMQAHIPGAKENPAFWASGVSLVIHPRSPFVPIIHMNTRYIITTQEWIGGGIDLTPVFIDTEDVAFFHTFLQQVCDSFDPTYYPRFKSWADDYFFIPHRQEPRGVGGIFYDNVNSQNADKDFAFNQAVGQAFIPIYEHLVKRHWEKPWGQPEKEAQLKKRGRYTEFNLLYDRGTQFGLKTNGNIEAILMSLPPQACWPVPEGLTEGLQKMPGFLMV